MRRSHRLLKTPPLIHGVLALVMAVGLQVSGYTAEHHSFLALNRPIPDGNTSGLSDHRLVTSSIGSLTALRVQLRINGQFNGDLYGYLRQVRGPVTNFCVLVNRPGRTTANAWGYDDSGLSVTLDDAAVNGNLHLHRLVSTPPHGAPLVGVWQPDGREVHPLSVLDTSPVTTTLGSFSGSPGSGVWTLFLADVDSGATNMLVEWVLEFEGTPVQVVGRHIFYNRSAWDGNNSAANATDDRSIAPDKTALLPAGTATRANYTSYSRGINGLMVDIAGLPGVPTVADFNFRMGTNSTLANWVTAPAPTSITVRHGVGVGGSDRVTLIWADNVIQKKWLQVAVLATANTGLADPDVFYFGNAIGESGNNLANAQVTTADALQAQAALVAFAALDNRFDFNRDGRVASADPLIAQSNLSALTPLLLINLGGGGDLAPSVPPPMRDASVQSGRFDGDGLKVQVTHLPGAAVLTVRQYVGPEVEAVLLTTDTLTDPRWIPAGAGVARAGADGWVDWTLDVDPRRPQAFFSIELAEGVRTESSTTR